MKGRKSGEWRRTPVNLLKFEGARYLVAPRGKPHGCATCGPAAAVGWCSGGRAEEFTAKEVSEGERVPLLRAYLEKWKGEVGAFFDGVGPDAPTMSSAVSPPTTPPSGSTTSGHFDALSMSN